MIANQRISARGLFLFGIALLPLLVVKGSVRAFAEPKLAVLLFLTLLCLLELFRRQLRSVELSLGAFHFGMVALLLCELPSLPAAQNTGLLLNAAMLQLSLLIVSIWVANSSLSQTSVCRATSLTVGIVCTGALAMSLFRVPLFSDYAPFGSTIGLKNSVAVYLAQTVPFLLFGLTLKRSRRGFGPRLEWAVLFALLSVALWVIFAFRTRSAWWMILFYLAALVLYAIRSPKWRQPAQILIATSIAGAALCYLVPGQLNWRSKTPYLDSISTLASLEHSSGRDKLWGVALEIIAQHPARGIGLGNYPALWPGYLSASAVDPKEFAFLRPDLPLFNDYLQSAVECGAVAMLLFLITILVPPVRLLYERFSNDESAEIGSELFALCCLATAIDAMFDAPFTRPETVLLFAFSAGVVARELHWCRIALRSRIVALCYVVAFLFVGAVFVRLTGSVLLRRHFAVSAEPAYLARAWQLWPWSSEWNSSFSVALQRVMDAEQFSQVAAQRAVDWPHDPESYLLLAKSREQQRRFGEVFDLFRRAIVTVPGGRCYHRGYRSYDEFIRAHELTSDSRNLSEVELAICR